MSNKNKITDYEKQIAELKAEIVSLKTENELLKRDLDERLIELMLLKEEEVENGK
jgi:cell division protein FtsB